MVGFEDKVFPLTELEKKVVPLMKSFFTKRTSVPPINGLENVRKSTDLCDDFNNSVAKFSGLKNCGLNESEIAEFILTPQRLSRFVKYLRVNEHLLIGSCSKGYYMIETVKEADQTLNSFYERIIGCLISVKGLEDNLLNISKDGIEYRKQILKLTKNWGGYTP